MRLFTVALGLIGPEFKLIRRLLCQPMNGYGAWRHGPPEKKGTAPEADVAPPVDFFEAQAQQVTDTITAAIEANLAETTNAV